MALDLVPVALITAGLFSAFVLGQFVGIAMQRTVANSHEDGDQRE